MFVQMPLPTVDEMEELRIRLILEKLQKEQEKKDETDRIRRTGVQDSR